MQGPVPPFRFAQVSPDEVPALSTSESQMTQEAGQVACQGSIRGHILLRQQLKSYDRGRGHLLLAKARKSCSHSRWLCEAGIGGSAHVLFAGK